MFSKIENRCEIFLKSKVLLIILLIKLLLIIFFQARYSSDFSLTNITDNDGANTIAVLERTQLFNDNDWYPYGPVYYRLARIMNIVTHTFGIKSESLREESLYFSTIFISLVSCLLGFYFVLQVYFKDSGLLGINMSLLAFFILTNTSQEVFVKYLLLPHPDYTQGLFLAISSFYILKFLESSNLKEYFIACGAIGIALSVKLSSIYFAFAFFVSLLLTQHNWKDKKHLKLIILGITAASLCYFVVGFPQNIKIHKTLYFLKRQTKYHAQPDLNSMLYWCALLVKSTISFVPFIFFLPKSQTAHSRKLMTFSLTFVGIFFVSFMLTVNTIMGADHYIIPILFPTLVTLVIIKGKLVQNLYSFPMALLAIALIFLPYPVIFSDSIAQKDDCRLAVKQSLKLIETLAPAYEEVIIDAYAPLKLKSSYSSKWGLTSESFSKSQTLFSLNWNFANGFFANQDAWTTVTNPEWFKHRELYLLLRNNESFNHNHILFRKLKKIDCEIEVWEAINSGKLKRD